VRPDTHVAAHYTGIILKRGVKAPKEFEEGKRILFEQFSGFEKYQAGDGKTRYAFVMTDACLAFLPKRANVEAGDDDKKYGD